MTSTHGPIRFVQLRSLNHPLRRADDRLSFPRVPISMGSRTATSPKTCRTRPSSSSLFLQKDASMLGSRIRHRKRRGRQVAEAEVEVGDTGRGGAADAGRASPVRWWLVLLRLDGSLVVVRPQFQQICSRFYVPDQRWSLGGSCDLAVGPYNFAPLEVWLSLEFPRTVSKACPTSSMTSEVCIARPCFSKARRDA